MKFLSISSTFIRICISSSLSSALVALLCCVCAVLFDFLENTKVVSVVGVGSFCAGQFAHSHRLKQTQKHTHTQNRAR